ncbi:MAG: DMT family transporter [Candidatus Obscuribacterales bacterium]|nr:DMT family transporter [Candidatus Obscuribacterales bacterium]
MNRPFLEQEKSKGLAAAILAPFFIALSIILTKIIGTAVHPLIIGGAASLFSVPCLFVIYRLMKMPLEFGVIWKDLRRPFIEVLFSRAIIGQALIITGFTMTTAVKSVLLLRLEAVFVFIFSVLLHKEKAHLPKILLLSALLIGSILVVAPSGDMPGPNLGDGLVVLSLLFLSYSYIPTKKVVLKASPGGLNILCSLIGGIALTLLSVICCSPQALNLSVQSWQLIAAYSLVFHIIAASLYFYAFKTLKAWIIASFLSLEVVFGLILAFFMLHETMTPLQIFGAAIVLIATAGIGRFDSSG